MSGRASSWRFAAAALACAALPSLGAAAERDALPGEGPGSQDILRSMAVGAGPALSRTAPLRPARAGDVAWSEGADSFPLRLEERLRRESRRFTDLLPPVPDGIPDPEADLDEEGRAARGRRVERLLTRAIRGALDDHLTERARTSSAFDGLFRLLDARDGDDRDDDGGPGDAAAGGTAPGFESTFRVKLDAHPRLQWRARLGAVTGTIEVPVLDPGVRLEVSRPLGAGGRAALSGGHTGERGGWATLALSFSF